ncbi:hypothetical protein [Patiriisocius sp. Uisw_017]|jgi:hypothetical protein|uniref:hypothetical protein n=1 Tax=Patiriisocius sp. Uisw_017 TaxID=3230968 RepID=UPI0039EC152D
MKLTTKFLSFLLLGFCYGCGSSDDPGCVTLPVNAKSLENRYGCENTKNLLEIDTSEIFVIISTQQQFENLVSGPCMPQIDFTTYDLIIGEQVLSSGNNTITYEETQDCTTNILEVTVTFNQNESAEAPTLTFHLLVPKLSNPNTTTVDIVIN